MAIYKVKLKRRQEIASGTMAFHFEKPEGFAYKAGQFGDFTLANPPETDAEGNTRGFSLASAPYEGDLMVATRMRDTAFKRVLKTMALGTEVSLDAPYGSLTLHSDAPSPPSSSRAASASLPSGALSSRPPTTSSPTRSSSSTRTEGPRTRRSWRNWRRHKRGTRISPSSAR